MSDSTTDNQILMGHAECGVRLNPPSVVSIVSLMRSMSQADREAIIDHFCHHCGSDNPQCQCWNDE